MFLFSIGFVLFIYSEIVLSVLADKLTPLSNSDLKDGKKNGRTNAENLDEHDGDEVYLNYLHFFKVNRFYK